MGSGDKSKRQVVLVWYQCFIGRNIVPRDVWYGIGSCHFALKGEIIALGDRVIIGKAGV